MKQAKRWWSRRGKENRKHKPALRWGRFRSTGLMVLVFVLVLFLLPERLKTGWSLLTQYVERHPYFTVQEVVIDESAGFSQALVREWSGVSVGMSMWDVDPERVESQLLSRSWIQSAQVRRAFPRRVHLAVSVRQPIAIVLHDPPFYLDESGVYFRNPEWDVPMNLPYISGFSAVAIEATEVRTALEGVPRLLALSRSWKEPLSEIHWDAREGYSLFLEQRRVTVRLGQEHSQETFDRVGVVLAQWPPEAPAAVFDARFADQVVVRPYAGENSALSPALSRSL
ncbi:MAG: FtsQ-type POTRA domain-containing protein [Deltaproteobacteria bacterium]|nr:FtsQ-type POTRA domain-containing protein [Deltaproteobacteria bacterium]